MHLVVTAVQPSDQPVLWLVGCAILLAAGLVGLGVNFSLAKVLGLVAASCGVAGLLEFLGFFDEGSIGFFFLSLFVGIISLPEVGRSWKPNKSVAIFFAFAAAIGLFVAYITLKQTIDLPTGTVGDVLEQGVERLKDVVGIADDELKQRM